MILWLRKALVLAVVGALALAAQAQAASYFAFESQQEVRPLARAPGASVPALPNKLVIAPSLYKVSGKVYDMRREGLYRFSGEQRIVYKTSLDTFMSSLSWIMHHSAADDGLPPDQAVSAAMTRDLLMTCGYQVEVARYLLKGFGFRARAAAIVNFDYNDTHTLVEVQRNGLWELWDLDYNAQPLTNGGRPTTIVDWVYDTDRTARILSRDERVLSTSPHSYGNYLNIPMLSSDAQTWPYYYTDPADQARMSAINTNYRYLAPSQFYGQFYPAQSVTHP
jgi:hypothetical protein